MSTLNISFVSEVLADSTQVPNLLLSNYSQLGLTAEDLIKLLRIIKCGNWREFTLEDVTAEFAITGAEAKELLSVLIKKGFIGDNNGIYNPDGLARAVFELWIDKKRSKQTYHKSKKKQDDDAAAAPPNGYGALYRVFEDEMGRPLSGMENEKLLNWLSLDGFSCDMVKEALKRAVLQRKANFNYINGILDRWKKAGYKTVKEVEEGDGKERVRGKKEGSSHLMPKSDYSDIYKEILKA